MFKQLKNIDTAFRYVRLFTFVVIGASATLCCFTVYQSYKMVSGAQDRIYLLANDQVLQAISADRKGNVAVEARGHIKLFHNYFFSLDPDEKVIEENIGRALYLADESAKKQYDDLKESGYYSSVISGNISQKITDDSIKVDMTSYPYHFRYYGKQKIIRSSATVERSLVTEGYLRNVNRSDNNLIGFLIEDWRILENKDLDTKEQ